MEEMKTGEDNSEGSRITRVETSCSGSLGSHQSVGEGDEKGQLWGAAGVRKEIGAVSGIRGAGQAVGCLMETFFFRAPFIWGFQGTG